MASPDPQIESTATGNSEELALSTTKQTNDNEYAFMSGNDNGIHDSTEYTKDTAPDALQLLLTIAQGVGAAPITLSGDMLAALLLRLNGLQSEISSLHTRFAVAQQGLGVAKTEMAALQRAAGVLFPKFMKLPYELRRMIWRRALRIARVVALDLLTARGFNHFNTTSHKGHSPLRSVCQESRVEADQRQKSINIVGNNQCTPSIFIRPQFDTLWLRSSHQHAMDIRLAIESMGYCNKSRTDLPRIPHLAIGVEAWRQNFFRQTFMFLEQLNLIAVEKVYVVVKESSKCQGAKIAFVEPRHSVKYAITRDHKAELSRDFQTRLSNGQMTWEDLGNSEMQYIRDFQDERAQLREDMKIAGVDMSQIDYEDEGDASYWNIAEIVYVDATTYAELGEESIVLGP